MEIHTYLALDIDTTVFVLDIEGPGQLLHVSVFINTSHNIIKKIVLCWRHHLSMLELKSNPQKMHFHFHRLFFNTPQGIPSLPRKIQLAVNMLRKTTLYNLILKAKT